MRRREVMALLAATAAVSPFGSRAQTERVRRVGILMPSPPFNPEFQERVRAFREELQKRGWASGVNVQFDERWTGDNMDLIRSAASNLVELNPDAILANGGRVIPILMGLTRSIPIVIPGVTDPVGRGYVKSLAHPGGNVTGFALMELSVIGKMLQILKEIAPQISRVTMIYNPDNPAATMYGAALEAAAPPLGIEPTIAHVHGVGDIERAAAAAAERSNGGVFVAPDVTLYALTEQTVAINAQHRLPAIYSDRNAARLGGLVYYGTNRLELFRRAASYVDRILRGEKPGDLLYEQPTVRARH